MGTLHEDRYSFVIISAWVILRMRTISDESRRENQSTHFIFSNFVPKIALFMDNLIDRDRPQMAIWYGSCGLHAACIACLVEIVCGRILGFTQLCWHRTCVKCERNASWSSKLNEVLFHYDVLSHRIEFVGFCGLT